VDRKSFPDDKYGILLSWLVVKKNLIPLVALMMVRVFEGVSKVLTFLRIFGLLRLFGHTVVRLAVFVFKFVLTLHYNYTEVDSSNKTKNLNCF
jgi:hypothetical protein